MQKQLRGQPKKLRWAECSVSLGCLASLAKKLAGLCVSGMGRSPGAAQGPLRQAEPQHWKPGDTIGLQRMGKPRITHTVH